jgi:outer membrane protein, heavy metal efflux system
MSVAVAGMIPAQVSAQSSRCARATDSDCREPANSKALTLPEALALAVERSPELQAASLELRLRDAATLQAGLRGNPELSLEVEDVGMMSDRMEDMFSESETTLALRLPIETGKKRAKRVAVAQVDRKLADWDYESKRMEVMGETARAFAEMLASQERVALAHEFVQISQAEQQAIRKRVESGAASAIERAHVDVAVASSRMEERLAQRKLDAARRGLAATWSSGAPEFDRVRGEFWAVKAPPSWSEVERDSGAVPELRRWESELEQRRAALAVAQAERLPNMELRAGVRRRAEDNESALVFEIGGPLMIFDRNQGAIEQSNVALDKLRSERSTAQLRVRKNLAGVYESLMASYEESRTLEDEILPLARSAFESARQGHQIGRFRYVEVLDAQRTLYELRSRQIDALAAHHTARMELSQALGTLAPAAPRMGGAP